MPCRSGRRVELHPAARHLRARPGRRGRHPADRFDRVAPPRPHHGGRGLDRHDHAARRRTERGDGQRPVDHGTDRDVRDRRHRSRGHPAVVPPVRPSRGGAARPARSDRVPANPVSATGRLGDTAAELGPIPERGDQRGFKMLAVLAPLAAGLTLFAFSRQVQFLALTLMSPLVMIATSVDDKRSGRKRFRDELATYRERIVEWRGELDALVEAERIERVRPHQTSRSWPAAPSCAPSICGPAAATARTSSCSERAWERCPSRSRLNCHVAATTISGPRRRWPSTGSTWCTACRSPSTSPTVAWWAARPRRRGQRRGFVDGDPGGVPAQPRRRHDRRRGR